jgi:hypothetical protein
MYLAAIFILYWNHRVTITLTLSLEVEGVSMGFESLTF